MFSLDTTAVHAGRDGLTDQGLHAVPIDLSTTAPLPSVHAGGLAYEHLATGGPHESGQSTVYQRLWNPTVARFETGVAVVSTLNGKRLADVVGASGVAFNQSRGLNYTAYGYPAAAPYDGQRLWSCAGKATNDRINSGNTTQGIPCTMTGGSSGGPWFIGTGSNGLQNSVNSYGYNGVQMMYGPYWGTVIQNTYKTAAAA